MTIFLGVLGRLTTKMNITFFVENKVLNISLSDKYSEEINIFREISLEKIFAGIFRSPSLSDVISVEN